MSNNVFANGMEVSCKSGSGKSIACLPDVCMTPPENPATPPGVPVPYPNTGQASDSTSGTRNVKISKKEASIKNSSYFKKSMGDEAGSAAKKGVVSSKNRGKVYFTAWSMDVKFEGENAVRHLDMTTHNHGSPTNTAPWPFIDSMAIAEDGSTDDPCAAEKAREETACDGKDVQTQCEKAGLGSPPEEAGLTGGSDVRYGSVYSATDGVPDSKPKSGERKAGERDDSSAQVNAWEKSQSDPCLRAKRCRMAAYSKNECCPGQTPHHLIDDAYASQAVTVATGKKRKKHSSYSHGGAPCICVEGNSNTKGSHGMMHAHTKQYLLDNGYDPSSKTSFDYTELRDNAADTVGKVFPQSQCSEKCMKAQMDAYYKDQCDMTDDTTMDTNVISGRAEDQRTAQIAWAASRKAALS